MWLLASIVIKGIFGGLIGIFTGIFQRRKYTTEGGNTQKAKETLITAEIETRIAEAEANAPKTKEELTDILNNGGF